MNPESTRETPGENRWNHEERGAPWGRRAALHNEVPEMHIPGTQLAVTEGFEPSVALATPAFEAGTFGRSDTSP